MIWIKLEDNSEVTDYYLETIKISFEKLGRDVRLVKDFENIKCSNIDTIVISRQQDVINAKKLKPYHIVLWIQGVWPEESYMRNHSKWRYCVTSIIEKWAIKQCDFIFLVSKAMKKHYENKYELKLNNFYIMPCSNEIIHQESFKTENKYMENVFCYAGGTFDAWHCFEDTVKLYSLIEKKYPNSKLLLLVRDNELAEKMVKKYGIHNYEISFVPVDQLKDKLKNVKYGFILRKPSVVNEVATPTKAMTYISNGIIPIYSECLVGLNEILTLSKYTVPLSSNTGVAEIEKIMNENIDGNDVLNDFYNLYLSKYDRNKHIDNICKLIESGSLT